MDNQYSSNSSINTNNLENNQSNSNSTNISSNLPSHWGQLGYLTEQQNKILNDFINTTPIDHITMAKYTVETIEQVSLRFLRARQFDLQKAMDLIAECYKRKVDGRAKEYASMKPEDAAACDVAAFKNFYPHTQRGYDKQNRILLFERNGRTDVNPVFLMMTKETLLGYHWWTMEYTLDQMFIEASKRFGGVNEDGTPKLTNISTCAILDFTDLGLSHCSSRMMELVKMFVSLDNVCYPEMLGKMLVINAPWLAVQTWNIVKGWLDPRTQAKIEIIGSKQESIKRLHELISIEYLPEEFGGTARDLYYVKPYTEYIQIGRSGELVKTITVPANKTLFVDTYLGNESIEITVSSYIETITTSANTKKNFFGRSSTSSTTQSHQSNEIQHIKQELHVPLTNPPKNCERLLLKLPFQSETKTFKIVWKNLKFSSRPLIYTLTISENEEYPDMTALINQYTSLKLNNSEEITK